MGEVTAGTCMAAPYGVQTMGLSQLRARAPRRTKGDKGFHLLVVQAHARVLPGNVAACSTEGRASTLPRGRQLELLRSELLEPG